LVVDIVRRVCCHGQATTHPGRARRGRRRLYEIFGIDSISEPERASKLQSGIAQAALAEYLLLLTGERSPSTMRDLRELRLRLLARHLPEQLPSDEQIADIFKLTRTQASTLVNGTRARYRQEFAAMLNEAAKKALKGAQKVNDNTVRIEASASLAAYLEETIRSGAPPAKRTDAARQYNLVRATVEELCGVLGLPVEEVKALPKKKR
jgi:hypothetical protein